MTRPAHALTLPPDLKVIDLRLEGDPRLSKRATVAFPLSSRIGRLPVLILLHGLGETHNETEGAFAWIQRYGLLSSYQRLLHPPVNRADAKHRYLTPTRAEQINHQLALRPFQGMILVCPFTPNVFDMNTRKAIADYGAWLVQILLPEVRKRTPARQTVRATGIDGCSLGGYISYQVFQQRPQDFYTCGGVQAAFGKPSAAAYAARMAEIVKQHGKRAIHVQTSSEDPYHDANVLFSKHMAQRRVPHDLRVPPGPHNQPWLIDVGTLEMLLWHDRQFAGDQTP